MRFPEEENWLSDLSFMTTMLALTFAMMFSLYVVVCGSCLTVFAYQLGLLGTDGQSLEDAVIYLRSRRISLFLAAFAGLICLIIAGIALTWVRVPCASCHTCTDRRRSTSARSCPTPTGQAGRLGADRLSRVLCLHLHDGPYSGMLASDPEADTDTNHHPR